MPFTDESEAGLHGLAVEEIDRQLARLLESHHFSRSSRYPALLQYLVQQVLMGNSSRLKERLVGIEVFHRTPDYDTNTDPVVRVTAAEVRKRIAQYYQETEHAGEIRIDLPTGSYIPRFLPARVALTEIREQVHAGEEPHPEEMHGAQAHGVSAGTGALSLHAEDAAGVSPAVHETSGHATFDASGPVRAEPHRSRAMFERKQVLLLFMLALVIGAGLAGGGLLLKAWIEAKQTRALRQLWAPLDAAQSPLLFVIGDHSLDDKGHSMGIAPIAQNTLDTVLTQMNQRSQVPLEDLISLDRIHAFLTRDEKHYRDKGAAEATLEDLRSGPVVLYAGFDNRWSVHLSQQLRFRLVPNLESNFASIVDSRDPSRNWSLNFAEPVNRIVSDYGIVARYFDPLLEQNVLLVAGIGSMGTAAASEFVTEERFSREIVQGAPAGWKNGNFEIVLSAPVIDGHAGPPKIIAATYW